MIRFDFIKNVRRRATTLVESLISVAVVGFGFAGFISMNSQQLRTVRSTHEVISSNLCLQERIEQMRIATWKQLTDAQYVKTTFFAAGPLSAAPISNLTEQLKVTAYPDEKACNPLIVNRSGNGAVVMLGNGDGLFSQRTAKVLLEVSWTSQDGRVRKRQSVAIVSNGGVNRMTLPAFGAVASGTTPSNTSSGTTTTTTTTTTTGNGNGRGNVGKSNGKN